jgi:hypothetical protein
MRDIAELESRVRKVVKTIKVDSQARHVHTQRNPTPAQLPALPQIAIERRDDTKKAVVQRAYEQPHPVPTAVELSARGSLPSVSEPHRSPKPAAAPGPSLPRQRDRAPAPTGPSFTRMREARSISQDARDYAEQPQEPPPRQALSGRRSPSPAFIAPEMREEDFRRECPPAQQAVSGRRRLAPAPAGMIPEHLQQTPPSMLSLTEGARLTTTISRTIPKTSLRAADGERPGFRRGNGADSGDASYDA